MNDQIKRQADELAQGGIDAVIWNISAPNDNRSNAQIISGTLNLPELLQVVECARDHSVNPTTESQLKLHDALAEYDKAKG